MKKIDYPSNLRDNALIIKKLHPNEHIYCLGVSFGANVICKFIELGYNIVKSEECKETIFKAAISVDNPFDLVKSEHLLNYTLIEIIFLRFFFSRYQKLITRFNGKCDTKWYKHSLRDFESQISGPLFGKTLDDYLKYISCGEEIDKIDIPILFINAKNDPIAHDLANPKDLIKNMKNAIFINTSHGSHTCYLKLYKDFKIRQWFTEPCIAFIDNL